MQTLHFIATEKKLRLLQAILDSGGEKVRVRGLAARLRINPGYTSTMLKRMEREGMIREGRLDMSDPVVRSLKIVSNIGRCAGAWKALRKKGAIGFGVFGSWAKGSNTPASDIDVWIKVRKEPGYRELSDMRHALKEGTGSSEAAIIVLTPERLEKIKKEDQLFYSTLLNSFHVGGEQID